MLKCRVNYVTLYPEEFLTIPVNKEPDLTANFIGLQQDWSNGIMLHQVLDNDSNLCTFDNIRTPKKPVRMEYDAFVKATKKRLEILKTHYNDDFCALLHKAKPIFGIFNIYGHIVLKKYKGCAFFYKLVNSSRTKYDCWLTPKNSMERDFMSIDLSFNIDKDMFYDSIRDILRIRYFNKLKEFIICFYRNNLYLNTRSCKWDNEKSNLCLNCKDDELETRIHIFQTFPTTKELLTFLERILTRAEHLQLGNTRYLFLYERYKVNAIENMSLIFLMRFIYSCKFNNVPVNKVTFAYSYRQSRKSI